MLSQAWPWGRHHSVLAWGQSCHGAMLRRWAKSGLLLGLLKMISTMHGDMPKKSHFLKRIYPRKKWS